MGAPEAAAETGTARPGAPSGRRFVDRVALVTGASRGIGAATAVALAAEGARVAVNYRTDATGAERTLRTIREAGGTAEVYRADVGDAADVTAMAEGVAQALGPVDVLVNNAAQIDRSHFLEVTPEAFETAFNANVRGVFQLSQIVARSMAERGGGAIVNISSILARLACRQRTAYITTKGAVESLTRAMALDLAPYGIRVNAVAPGLIATEALLTGMPDPELQTRVQSFIPEKRFGHPSEITEAILFLASTAASYVNGAVLGVDGGLGGTEAGPAG